MKLRQLLATAILSFASSLAMAGQVVQAPLEITVNPDGSGSAQGDLVTVRSSKDDVQYIGCNISGGDTGAGGAYYYGFCQASDANGQTVFCYSDNAELLDAIKGLNDFSFVHFTWSADGVCRSFYYSTQSFYIPNFKGNNKK